ncbi:MAG: SLC13 family permease [Gemmatimonadota bacterium]
MKRLALPLGLGAAAITWILPAPAGMPPAAWTCAGVAVLMAVWWVTEAVPLPATALVPLVAFPWLGLASMRDAAAPFANPVIFLFLGGFIIAAALARCGLHRRIALAIVAASGTGPKRLVAGFMIATAFLSMWVSNTATVLMMVPIAGSVLALSPQAGEADETDGEASDALAVALLLGVAYAANIGGMGTLIGTPPNALLAGFMDEAYGVRVGFVEWMMIGVPLLVVALPITWLVLTRDVGSASAPSVHAIAHARAPLGPPTRAERFVGAITAATALAWITRPVLARWIPGLSDAGIAVAGALTLFVVAGWSRRPDSWLDWDDVEALPWGVLILFGGGLSLSAVIQSSGLADWIGGTFAGTSAWPLVAVVAAVTTVIIFLTELTSNTATAAAFLPVAAAVAVGMGADPILLAAAVALAASGAFMMPVATPPNAIVYGTGRVPIGRMIRAGILLNLLFIVLVTATVRLLGPFLA